MPNLTESTKPARENSPCQRPNSGIIRRNNPDLSPNPAVKKEEYRKFVPTFGPGKYGQASISAPNSQNPPKG
jgi:hypothetical protein